MSLTKLSYFVLPLAGVAIVAAGCSSTSLTAPRHDSGADVTVTAQHDSGPDTAPVVRNDASDARTTPADSSTDTPPAGYCLYHAPTPSEVPKAHRAEAVPCASRPNTSPVDGISCTSNADCATDAGYGSVMRRCFHGHCSLDGCLTDADCPDMEVCDCAQTVSESVFVANICRPANCHVDSDCGPGRFCSGNSINSCGGRDGYYCQGPNDTCVNREDCACGMTCRYDPTVAAFRCLAVSVCGG
ncbi:MAG: hypothetical protein ACJ8F1_12075 [Polyangia bacterium]